MRYLLILLLALPAWVNADVYVTKDAAGGQHYSDKAQPDAKVVNIPAPKPGYEFFKVRYIYDGDTIQLEDKRKIRFLGVNTPEVEHHGSKADPGGEEAKAWLVEHLKGTKVRIETGSPLTDDYGRTLAHVFTEKGEHLNLQLVANGLAEVSIFPPNLMYVDELINAEDQAEAAKLGIWHRPEFAAIPVENLTAEGHAGYTRVIGTVAKVRATKKSVYLDFTDRFKARIDSASAGLFPDPKDYQGKTLEVRGWLANAKGKLTMLIRHPGAIKVR